jgi:hypothetical protein
MNAEENSFEEPSRITQKSNSGETLTIDFILLPTLTFAPSRCKHVKVRLPPSPYHEHAD